MPRTAMTILIVTGAAHAADIQPQPAPLGTMPGERVAHIYYNAATGEKIAVPLGGIRPADGPASAPVWIADNTLPCAAFGQTEPQIGLIDSPCTDCFDSTLISNGMFGFIYFDWGDIPPDTVVDCVGITWSTQHEDTDLDGDGVGDGVEGFGATWAWYDGENGFDSSSTRKEIVSITLRDLPGQIDQSDPLVLATYEATIDLAPGAGPSLAFEIGDTDSVNDAGTPFFNPGGGLDLDFDGLTDFGYSLQYTQPGTVDFDGDGMPDGDPDNEAATGWLLVTGNGGIGSDGSYIPETSMPGAQGIEDAIDVFYDFDNDGILQLYGTVFYLGFACDLDGNGAFEPGRSNPYAQFYMKLYGPGGGWHVDCGDFYPPGGGDGALNFFDIATYLDLFNSQSPLADYFPVGEPDGLFNFFDITQFLSEFNAGCP